LTDWNSMIYKKGEPLCKGVLLFLVFHSCEKQFIFLSRKPLKQFKEKYIVRIGLIFHSYNAPASKK